MLRSSSCTLIVLLLIGAGGRSLHAQTPADTVTTPDSTATTAPVKLDPSRITAAEIAAARVATAYEAVERLHRAWFKDRMSGKAVTIYTDGNRHLGGAESLRRIPAVEIVELRYLDGRAARLRWPEADGGVIIVVQNR
jgi:hypothetical protein